MNATHSSHATQDIVATIATKVGSGGHGDFQLSHGQKDIVADQVAICGQDQMIVLGCVPKVSFGFF
jgi:hypothetical protein